MAALVVGACLIEAKADQTKANNNNHLELGASWVMGVAPGSADRAVWDATLTTPANCTNTLGVGTSWNGIVLKNPSAPVVLNGNTTLTNGAAGIDLGNATVNLTVDCGTIDLATNQIWNVPSGIILTTGSSGSPGAVNSPNNGNFVVTKVGGGVWTTSGTTDNGSTGIIINGGTVNLNKTSSGGTHAVGGPGLTITATGIARLTGAGGDQIYDGGWVTLAAGGTLDLAGHSETIGALTGAGGTVDNTAAGTFATLTVGGSLGNSSSTFAGSLQNSGAAAKLAFSKAGTGTLSLTGANTYTGGTTITGGTLALLTTNNVAMGYTNTSGVLSVTPAASGGSLPMTSLSLGSASPQLTFNFGGFRNLSAPLINDTGNLVINGNVAVNVQNVAQSGNYVLLRYAGARSGAGAFVAGTVPSGATITDDTVNQRLLLVYVSAREPRVFVPVFNTNEIVVALATPQQYGAKGDGLTDDSAAFQNAMNAVYNSGGAGGGVVFVPAATYAFYTNLVIPTGVTLHGDWQDWTSGGAGLVGTTFKVYFGAGQATNTAFVSLSRSSGLRDINFWYPNQSATNIVPYPFTIGVGGDSVVQNVALVNAYQGIQATAGSGAAKHILRTVVGSPLYKGIEIDQIFDVCHAEDLRFSPDVWPASLLTNAPASGGPHAAWMRANGEAMRLLRVDGEICFGTWISGYHVGIEANTATNGQPGAAFYSGCVSNCATALLAQDMPSAFGLMFANFTLDGDIAVNRTNTADDANILFDHCGIIGRTGPAVNATGNDWHSWMQFQSCTISNALQLAGPGVFNVVNSTLFGATQAVLSATATRAAFTGCAFGPTTNLVNRGSAGNLLLDARPSLANSMPLVQWSSVASNFLSRRPASTNLYVATENPWGAYGDGIHDDSAAIQSALNAAGIGGGGIVYLPAGKYHLTNTLDVPGGVELRGAYELRHATAPGSDGHAKGTVLQPYAGQGTTNGPPAIALEANAGLVGMTISYESQNSTCLPFPPAIQGRGANVYAIGVCCPNPYQYVDLDTYSCTNHYLDMVDGWALLTGYTVGNGSSGSLVDCHGNWTYWVDNTDSASSLPPSIQGPVFSFISHGCQMYVLGACTEQMVADFSWGQNTFLRTFGEAGGGPNATLIAAYCDGTLQGIVLDAAGPGSLVAVNTPLCAANFGNFADLATASVAVLSTTNYQGTARFLNSVLWAGNYLDFNINGGDVGFENVHMDNHSFFGSVVNGGVFHLVNNSAYITYNGTSNFPPYYVSFGSGAGMAGKPSEFVACFSENGCGVINPASVNTLNCWNDYALASYSILNPNLPVVYDVYPNGLALFQRTNVLGFAATSPAGIYASNLVLTVNGVKATNLVVSGSANAWNVTWAGLLNNQAYSVFISVTDKSGHVATATVNFDTFSPNNYTFEAEDFDYTLAGASRLFIDNPQTNGYAAFSATDGIDCHNASGGSSSYRPNPAGLATENAGDLLRAAFATGLQDYDVGWNNGGNWGNYTRTYPAGRYYVYMRAASPNGSPVTTNAATLSLVTGGFGTTNQTTTQLGAFTVPNTGDWHHFTWVPLLDTRGNAVQLTNNGASKTLRATTVDGGYNVNFYVLVPATSACAISISFAGTNSEVAVPTLAGYLYQVESKTQLTDPGWISVGNPIVGDGVIHSVADPMPGTSRFYRVRLY